MKPQDPERQYINDSPLDLSGREGYDAPSKCPVCGQRLNGGAHRGNCTARAQAASVDETLDKSTLDLLREIEQRAQELQRYANDHLRERQIVEMRALINQAIVKELSK